MLVPVLLALSLTLFSFRSSAQAPKADKARQPSISVVFNMHLDPVPGPSPAMRRAELERRRDNMLWLQNWIESIDPSKRPRLNIQMSGEHAEFFLTDQKGLEMLRRFYRAGHSLGTHFHRNIYLGDQLRWAELRPSRPLERPVAAAGEIITPGVLGEPNTLDEVRRLWRDNFRFTELLLVKVTGTTDPNELRKLNNHGEFQLPNSMQWKDVLFKEFGITVQTGGRNELFNMIFDHDVFNAWRPGTQAELGEDPRNSAYVCVPQLAVPGNIKLHQGVWQDLSVPAIERRFLQIVLERREHERLGLPPKAWTFGWTLHDFDIHPPEGLRERSRSQRRNVQELAEWISRNFIPQVAEWDTPNGVARKFREIEKEHPGASQFQYPERKRNWEAYPYRLKGVAQALIGAHYLRPLPDWQAQDACVFELLRAQPGAEWYTDENNEVKIKGGTQRILLAWSEGGPQKLKLGKYASGKLKLVLGVSGETREVDAREVPVGAEPVVIELQ